MSNTEKYEVYHGDNAYFLCLGATVLRTRQRAFKRAWWRTLKGAQAAADRMNSWYAPDGE